MLRKNREKFLAMGRDGVIDPILAKKPREATVVDDRPTDES